MDKPSILVVDDEVLIARELESRLQNLGYTVPGIASSADEAIALVEEHLPNLVLMDIVLKGDRDGIEAAAEIRRRHDIPVIYLTAYTDDATLRRAKVTEPFGYIAKPFSERELRANIEMALYKHEVEARLRRTEEQLRQAQKMEAIGRLAGGVAHDFNNLLTIISGYSNILLKQLPTGDDRDLVREIYKAGERAALLTRQLLAFSRKQVLEPKVLDLNAIVNDTEQMLRRLIGEDIRLTCTPAADLWPVKVDAGQIEQVVMNLVVNARDAMPKGGQLTLETANVELDESYAQMHVEVKPGRYVMLAVADTGTGMDSGTKERVFEPFFTTKPIGQGTGLGLATVYGIIKQSEGHAWVYSEPGQGTTIKVYLPAADAPLPPSKTPPNGTRQLRGDETILVVEDEAAVRGIIRLALHTCGYNVLEATRGDDGIRVCGEYQGPIHLLVTDVVMPELNGRQLAQRIMEMRPGIKVLYISGYTDDAVVRHGVLEAEMSFLQKPFTPLALTAKVRAVLDQANAGKP